MQPHNECSNITFKQPAASTQLPQIAVKSAGRQSAFIHPFNQPLHLEMSMSLCHSIATTGFSFGSQQHQGFDLTFKINDSSINKDV